MPPPLNMSPPPSISKERLEAILSDAAIAAFRDRPHDPISFVITTLQEISSPPATPQPQSPQATAATTLQRALRRQTSSQLNASWSMRRWLRSLSLHMIVAEALVPPTGADHFKWVTTTLQREAVEERLRARGLSGLARFVWTSIGQLRQQDGAATFEAVSASKFAGRTELDYGGLDVFFGGLEGKIGSPQPRVREAMEAEHTRRADSLERFTTGNYGVTTTSEIEFAIVTTPTADALARLRLAAWPAEASDKLPDRSLTRRAASLASFAPALAEVNQRLAAACQPALIEAELIALRMYTGPTFVKYNAVLRGLGALSAYLRAQLIELCASEEVRATYEAALAAVESAVAGAMESAVAGAVVKAASSAAAAATEPDALLSAEAAAADSAASAPPAAAQRAAAVDAAAVRAAFGACDSTGAGLIRAAQLPAALQQLGLVLEPAEAKKVS